jgi:hypothetical protein
MRKFYLGLAVAVTLFAAPSLAHADLELRYSINGGAFVTIGTTAPPGQVSGSVDGLLITATLTGVLGTGTSSLDLGVDGTLASAITSLNVEGTVTNVPTTPPPQTLTWSFSSSSDPAATETAQGFVDAANNPYGGATGGPPGTIVATTGVLHAPASGSTTFSSTPPYSWTEQYNLGATAAGVTISTDNNEHITASPEPSTLAIAGLGALGLIGYGIRRRRGA